MKCHSLSPQEILYRKYKRSANRKGLRFDVSVEHFTEVVTQPCHYCGDKSKVFNGIDRKDNSDGYVFGNCLPCCTLCNFKKGAMRYQDFLEWVEKVFLHTLRSSPKTLNGEEPETLKSSVKSSEVPPKAL
jgi:hypothetical protein